jgi:hypothetical protein
MNRDYLASAALALVLGLSATVAMSPGVAHAQIGFGISINVGFAPPELPVYDQPPIPGDGYIWTPGYWAYDDDYGDYYWVPGTWVEPPEPGLLWTPGYWGWNDGQYVFNAGYWAPQIGYYGGIDYGFGYNGDGYEGGYWQDNHFFYNRTVNNVTNVHITNVYERPVRPPSAAKVSFNGGPGGVQARPTPQQEAVAHGRHVPPTANQVQHVQTAAREPGLRASVNQGKPAIAATSRPNAFSGPGVVPAARASAPYVRPANAPRPGAPARSGPPEGARPPGPAARPEEAGRPPAPPPQGVRPTTEERTPPPRAPAEERAPPAPRAAPERPPQAPPPQRQERPPATAETRAPPEERAVRPPPPPRPEARPAPPEPKPEPKPKPPEHEDRRDDPPR